jgi:hypothetical protein
MGSCEWRLKRMERALDAASEVVSPPDNEERVEGDFYV